MEEKLIGEFIGRVGEAGVVDQGDVDIHMWMRGYAAKSGLAACGGEVCPGEGEAWRVGYLPLRGISSAESSERLGEAWTLLLKDKSMCNAIACLF